MTDVHSWTGGRANDGTNGQMHSAAPTSQRSTAIVADTDMTQVGGRQGLRGRAGHESWTHASGDSAAGLCVCVCRRCKVQRSCRRECDASASDGPRSTTRERMRANASVCSANRRKHATGSVPWRSDDGRACWLGWKAKPGAVHRPTHHLPAWTRIVRHAHDGRAGKT